MCENKNIVIGSALFNWGETHRMVDIGVELVKRGYHIIFLGKGKYDYLVESAPFERVIPENDAEWFSEERIRKMMDMDRYGNQYATVEELDKQISEEVSILERYKPSAVITGYRTTFSISARVAKVPLVWCMSAAMSPYYFFKRIRSLPENSVMNRYYKEHELEKNKVVLLEFMKKMMSVYDETSKAWNQINKKYGLPEWKSDLDIYKGELNLMSDAREFFEGEDVENETYKFCGPIYTSEHIELPKCVSEIEENGKKKILVIFGSSGYQKTFFDTLQEIIDLDYDFYIATTGKLSDEQMKAFPENFHFADKFPLYDTLQKMDACITHGGQGTIYTLVAAGKPFIGIPMFMEQQYNLETLTENHIGVIMKKKDVNKVNIEKWLHIILNDEKYIKASLHGKEIVEKYYLNQEYSAIKVSANYIEDLLNEKRTEEN